MPEILTAARIIPPCGLGTDLIPGTDRGLDSHSDSGTGHIIVHFILILFSMIPSTFTILTGLDMVRITPGITGMDMGAVIMVTEDITVQAMDT